MTEVIYLDIDGTLRDEERGIPPSAAWALSQCRRRGIRIVVCTGRNPASIQDDVRELPLDGMISGGGCYIRYQGETVWRKGFPAWLIEDVMTSVLQSELALVLETEQRIFMNGRAVMFYREDLRGKTAGLDEGQKQLFLMRNKIRYEDNLKSFDSKEQSAHKICVMGRKDAVERVKKAVGEEAQIAQEKRWNAQWYLELLPKGYDKGSAVRELNRRLGISKENTLCFGDSENDIAMMQAAGTAVAVKTNNPAIYRYASSVCEPVWEDGICRELIRRNIIKPVKRRGKR